MGLLAPWEQAACGVRTDFPVSSLAATVRAMPRRRTVHKPLEMLDVEVLAEATGHGDVRT
jgi:hypothetical protein